MPVRLSRAGIYCALLIFAASCGLHRSAVEDLSGEEDLSLFKVQTVHGTRDGDRLNVQAMISDSSSILSVDMIFAVGSPTKLQSGRWHWTHGNDVMSTGEVSEQSVTFLGGQDGPPSIGGSFTLLSAEGKPQYRINIPVTELKR